MSMANETIVYDLFTGTFLLLHVGFVNWTYM